MEEKNKGLRNWTAVMLKEYVNTEFEVCDDPANVIPLTLTEVVEYQQSKRTETFSLFFHGPLEPFMQQKIHKLKHPQLGEVEIFLVPIGQDKNGFQYEAAFNHMISS